MYHLADGKHFMENDMEDRDKFVVNGIWQGVKIVKNESYRVLSYIRLRSCANHKRSERQYLGTLRWDQP